MQVFLLRCPKWLFRARRSPNFINSGKGVGLTKKVWEELAATRNFEGALFNNLRIQISLTWITSKSVSAMPLFSTPASSGLNRTSGASNLERKGEISLLWVFRNVAKKPDLTKWTLNTVKRDKIIDSPFLSHFDDGSVWQSVIFDQAGGFCAQPLLHLGVVSDVAHFLLHYPDRLKVGRVVEGVTAQLHSTDQVLETMKTIN